MELISEEKLELPDYLIEDLGEGSKGTRLIFKKDTDKGYLISQVIYCRHEGVMYLMAPMIHRHMDN